MARFAARSPEQVGFDQWQFDEGTLIMEKLMAMLWILTLNLLRIIATVLVLFSLIGIVAISCEMILAVYKDMSSPNAVVQSEAQVVNIASVALYKAIASILLFPVGVFLHWIIAKRSNIYHPWVWWVIFLGSVVICSAFPVGTIMGGCTLWFLFTSDTFRKRRVS